jgi:hypothetical protein
MQGVTRYQAQNTADCPVCGARSSVDRLRVDGASSHAVPLSGEEILLLAGPVVLEQPV